MNDASREHDPIAMTIARQGTGAVSTASGLPPDLLQSASKRLAILALIMAALLLVNLFIYSLLPLLGGPRVGEPPGLLDAFVLGLLALSVGVFFVARSERLEARRKLDVALLYEVTIAFVVGVGLQLAHPGIRIPEWGVSEICLVIVLFPVIVPNTPGKTLVAALLAASMDPLGVALAAGNGETLPPLAKLAAAFHWNYLCVGLAVIESLVLNRLGREVRRAREMGAYRLTERLGQGAMGEVWKARHHLLARDAAIKIIQPERLLVGDEEAERLLRRFEREAQATATLESPHTVELYDFGVTEEGTFFYVMELLDGLDLDSMVRRYGPLPSERAARLLIQICHSLADAHDRGLIHRDVKPANVFVCRKGRDTDFVKVLDFGLVKSRAGVTDDPGRTVENAVLGTPAYMAPEMIRSGVEIDGRADLYSLGCVAYWLLTGKLVFEATSPMDVMIQHVNIEPDPPSARSELQIDSELEAIVLQCLRKERDERPASAAELMERLEDLGIARVWTSDRSRQWWKRHVPGTAAVPEVEPVPV